MTRRNVLIALVSVLSVALASVVTGIVTGFLPGTTGTDRTTGADGAAANPPPAATDDRAEQARYVGKSEDGVFTVAVHVWENNAIAHVTDGRSREAWMKGVSGGDQLLLTGDDGGVLNARVTGGKLAGTAQVGGDRVAFSTPAVPAPAGIYRASGEVDGRSIRVDVIVLPNREAAGIEWVDGRPSGASEADLSGQSVEVAGARLSLAAIRPGDV
ncbi:hypothetical protein [Actinoplanes sp. G11-F43]|uniref:hypothetical protein n=1 Tax=Actinoplanes sp. G11-F43 TaxID=3424130 RepID=UPI003D34E71C